MALQREAWYCTLWISDIIVYFSFVSFLVDLLKKMRSFSYNSGFSVFTVIDFTDLFPFCLFHQFTSAVPEFLKTPTTDQPPTRSTAPVPPTNTVSSAKPGPALVKVGTLHARWFEYLHLGLLSVALCTEDKSMCSCCPAWLLAWSLENETMEGLSRPGLDIWNDHLQHRTYCSMFTEEQQKLGLEGTARTAQKGFRSHFISSS